MQETAESSENRKKGYPRLVRISCVIFLFLFDNKCSLSERGVLLALIAATKGPGYGKGLMNLHNF